MEQLYEKSKTIFYVNIMLHVLQMKVNLKISKYW